MPCYRCGAREADPGRGARLWVRAVRADIQVLVCPECQQSSTWSDDVDHCPACRGTNLVRRLGQTVCRTCESSATAEFLAVESTMDRGLTAIGASGRHARPDGGRDLEAEVATALDRVLGRHAKRPPTDHDPPAAIASDEFAQLGDGAESSANTPDGDPVPADLSTETVSAGAYGDEDRRKGGRFFRGRDR